MAELILCALTGFTICFVGTIPFGPINLTVVKVTVDHGSSKGAEVALAASVIEILQAAIAIFFGLLILGFVEESLIFKFTLATVFVCIAFYIVSREPAKNCQARMKQQAELPKEIGIHGSPVAC